MSKDLQIRNSTVDFLVFTRDEGEDGIEVRVQNGDVWLTQKAKMCIRDRDYTKICFKSGRNRNYCTVQKSGRSIKQGDNRY